MITNRYIRLPLPLLAILVLLVAALSLLQAQGKKEMKHQMGAGKMDDKMSKMAYDPNDVSWGDAPPVLPAGVKLAVLAGNPMGKGLYTVRLKLPADYTIPPHWHPAQEDLTIISGSFNVGMGDQFDKANGKTFKTGGFGSMPAKMHHFAWTTEESVVQIHGMGPFTLTYVNPMDDPRKSSAVK